MKNTFKEGQKLTINKAFYNRKDEHNDISFDEFMKDEPINLNKLNKGELTYLWRICKFELNNTNLYYQEENRKLLVLTNKLHKKALKYKWKFEAMTKGKFKLNKDNQEDNLNEVNSAWKNFTDI
tara:strand:- start:167 stop:538 length:372 start_codon:yes stop_codon:yes gene_type:complete